VFIRGELAVVSRDEEPHRGLNESLADLWLMEEELSNGCGGRITGSPVVLEDKPDGHEPEAEYFELHEGRI
jgi:hypothetical protein